jgi:class 3 adenylate cyclase/tetratricopeptide (TPR) repeat protein
VSLSGPQHTLMLRALPPCFEETSTAYLSVYTLCCRGPELSHDWTLVAAMQQIADWLKKLGMSEYAERFVENRIDLSVLPDLTDQDLEKMGVLLGDRRKMLRAIRDLGTTSVAVTASSAPPPTEPTRQDDAERRQLTVMFTDLVGSTALSTRLDPEDLRFVIGAYHKCVAETVARFDGFVAKYMGDGVLIYFGYPHAHEDDAERAVRAGLALIETVGKLRVQEPFQVRIGVATGVVVVGDLVGSGEARERGVVGETPNLAARLQGIAAPNTVVIAEGTRRLLGNLFELEDLGPKDLKGIAGPARAWAALRARSVESRFEALRASGLTALVGREEETELLLRRWARAKAGEGQVVLIGGEAGIGKSRLTAALMESLGGEPHTRLRYFCSPQHTDSALYPIIGQMERAAGLTHDDTLQARLHKLDAMLAKTSTSIEDAALFAEMLSLPNDGRYPALELAPQQRRERTLKALVSQMEVLTHQGPVLMIFEDAHWIDPTSLEALGRVVDRIQTLRVLLIVTFRPEFNPPWIGQPHATAVTINRLTQRQVGAMIDGVVGNKLLPADLRQDIIERTDGIPLFVEEMTKAVLEADSEGVARHTVAALPSPALAVPASLHASLMARLDRLGPAKEVAQIGAAIGREFSHALLVAVAHRPETELAAALNRVVEAGLLFRQGVPPHANYLFKHALVQDAAYGTLLREPRRKLHAQIGTKLEDIFPEVAKTQPDLLAQHFMEGGLLEKALEYWLMAGQQSVSRSSMTEALSQLSKASALLSGTPQDTWRWQQELTLQIAIGSALIGSRGAAAPVVREAYERARQLWEILGRPSHFEPKLPLFWHHFIGGELNVASQIAKELVAIGTARDDLAVRYLGNRYLGQTCLWRGDFSESLPYLKEDLTLYDPNLVGRRTLDKGNVVAVGLLSLSLLGLGYPDQARQNIDQALLEARQFAHPFTLAEALMYTLFFAWWCRSARSTLDYAEEAIALNFDWQVSLVTGFRGWCLSVLGHEHEGVVTLTSALSTYRATGSLIFVPLLLMLLAEALEKARQRQAAFGRLAEAIQLIEQTQERWIEAELHRCKGELLKSAGNCESAEACFSQALAVARHQAAKTWELRAATSLARLWRNQGKGIEARTLLEPVYSWFTEGLETPHLREARSLLDELNADSR